MQIPEADAPLGLLAATMGSTARAYHCGYVVRDLHEAMRVLGEAIGVQWAPPMDLPITRMRTPDGAVEMEPLRLTYSSLPIHIELIEEQAGSIWVADELLRGHHLGVWADDLAAESARLSALGLPLHTSGLDDDGEMASFAYHETPFGIYIELVDSIAKAFYPLWFAQAS
jgi:Glyoxalase/Bleomycin resistance protein/Dioxygenase superfamily